MRLHVLLLCCFCSTSAFSVEPWDEVSGTLGKVGKMPSGTLSKSELARLIEIGGDLFAAKFTKDEGAGRPDATQAVLPTKRRARAAQAFARTSGPDANACVACHNDPLPGGAGDFVTTTFVSEGFNNAGFDTTDPQFSNERGSNHLFGAGLVELLAREMTADLQAQRAGALMKASDSNKPHTVALLTKGVSFGKLTARPDGLVETDKLDGVDADLTIRPFTQKGVMTSLRQFAVNAMNHHHGMQADERFGARWTGSADHDGDTFGDEMNAADISALVAWQATLPPPLPTFPQNERWREMAAKGSANFDTFGCAACHIRALPLESLKFSDPGPVDTAGTLSQRDVDAPATYDLALLDWAKRLPRDDQGRALVPLFGDLKRHTMTDRTNERLGNELLSQRFVDRTAFATSELWGIASTAPYGHRNDMTTLDEVIRAHGGEGGDSAKAYADAPEAERKALIAFLKTLTIQTAAGE
ncbi:MAG: di-heme oxidoredictase family protein [Pseudomonadota bacterium]